MSIRTCYDANRQRGLTRTDMPKGLSVDELAAFCAAHACTFLTLDVQTAGVWRSGMGQSFTVALQAPPDARATVDFVEVEAWLKRIKDSNIAAAQRLAQELVETKARLAAIGMTKTAAAMDAAVQQVGWEIDAKLTAIAIDLTHRHKETAHG